MLVPRFDLLGADLGLVAVAAIGATVSAVFARKFLSGLGGPLFLGNVVLASAVSSGFVYSLSSEVSDRVITLVPYSLLAIAILLASFKLLKLLSDEEKEFLTHALPKKLHWILRYL